MADTTPSLDQLEQTITSTLAAYKAAKATSDASIAQAASDVTARDGAAAALHAACIAMEMAVSAIDPTPTAPAPAPTPAA